MRARVVGAAALLLTACAGLPADRSAAERARAPTVVGAHGPMPPRQVAALLGDLEAESAASDVLRRHVAAEEELAGNPLVGGNEVTLLEDGPATYEAMFEAIEGARDHINIEFYIIEDGPIGREFSERLIRKVSQGVSVRLIYDSVGSLDTPETYFERLRAAGIQVVEFNPVNPLDVRRKWRLNNRDHRKMVIVDGAVAFLGGINISEVYSSGSTPASPGRARAGREPGWRDTNLRIRGPGVVPLQLIFLSTWVEQGGGALDEREWFPPPRRAGDHLVRVIASGPGDHEPAIYLTLLSVIEHAELSVHLTIAYFVPDDQTLRALISAARRGVDVTIIVPSRSDCWAVFYAGRAHYADLLDSGVKLYERQEALLHSKTAVIDGVWSTIGSSNIDLRSFLHNREVNAVVLGTGFAERMNDMFERDLARSKAIDPGAWAHRSLGDRIAEWTAELWEYWL